MKTEFEVKVCNINILGIREKLSSLGAILSKPKTLFKRVTFRHPINPDSAYIRVRDEGDKITCTSKIVDRSKDIDSVQEIEFEVSSFETCVSLLSTLGLYQKSYQETYRETWFIDTIQITIDERPGLHPFIEIEGQDRAGVEKIVYMLGYSWDQVVFGAVDEIYYQELGIPHQIINNIPTITFDQPPERYTL